MSNTEPNLELNQLGNRGTLLLDLRVRKRGRGDPIKIQKVASLSMDLTREDSHGGGTYTLSRDLSYRSGEWQKRSLLETTVIITEPRAADKLERDDHDSGISEAAEEHLLPGARDREARGGSAPTSGKKETVLETLIQVFIPFMIAGFGMMAAGLLLDRVQVCLCSVCHLMSLFIPLRLFFQHWDVYSNINELFILVPALLGLKGNLEMTLASRLSTAVRLHFSY